jgi:hypothetical protein
MIDENEDNNENSVFTHSVINKLFNNERTMKDVNWKEDDYKLFRKEIGKSIDQLARLNLDELVSHFMKINIEVLTALRIELIAQVMLQNPDLKKYTIIRKRSPQIISEDISKLIIMVAEKK